MFWNKDFEFYVPDRDIASLTKVLKCLIEILGFWPMWYTLISCLISDDATAQNKKYFLIFSELWVIAWSAFCAAAQNFQRSCPNFIRQLYQKRCSLPKQIRQPFWICLTGLNTKHIFELAALLLLTEVQASEIWDKFMMSQLYRFYGDIQLMWK